MEEFDIRQFDSYEEDNRKEVKKASGGLPNSLWETYSAFANCNGGVIILGVTENEDKSWQTTGLKDASKLKKKFWDDIHNTKVVSLNLLREGDVQTYTVNNDVVMVITVPPAKREEKPVYLKNDMFTYTYRRNWEGDYHCTPDQVKAMLRDQTSETYDMTVIEQYTIEDFDKETVDGYRNRHSAMNPEHPFLKKELSEYLRAIGAADISPSDKKLHPTAAGLLMFGKEYNIVRVFPNYFLDYREMLDPTIRWTDRIQSSSGEWSGNIFDFYFRVYGKITKDIKKPFKLDGIDRVDDTPVHKAVREALANCLVNADFYGRCGVVIRKENDEITLENPGTIRIGKKQMRLGGKSDPRNQALMKMFNLISIGERAGSGIPNVFFTWENEGYEEPVITEEFDPDRTVLKLSFKKKVTINNADNKVPIKSADKKVPIKGADNDEASGKATEQYKAILSYMQPGLEYKNSDISNLLGLKSTRTKILLREMVDQKMIVATGEKKARRYSLPN